MTLNVIWSQYFSFLLWQLVTLMGGIEKMNGSMDIASVPIWQAAAFLYQHLPNKTRYVQIASITETQILRKNYFHFSKDHCLPFPPKSHGTYSLVQWIGYTFDAVWSQIYFISHQKCIHFTGPNCSVHVRTRLEGKWYKKRHKRPWFLHNF